MSEDRAVTTDEMKQELVEAEVSFPKAEANLATMCMFDHGKKATETVRVEGQGLLIVCKPCLILLEGKNKEKRCQYCGVPIQNNWNKAALPGFHHQAVCPRNHDEDLIELTLPT